MSELILHHYDASPFSEKVRLVMGLKGLAWRSVEIPVIMPKPDYVELTGGYRRTPSLQIGADIYCDTNLILPVLDKIKPAPGICGDAPRGAGMVAAAWAEESLFWPVASYVIGLNAESIPAAFAADRAKMRGVAPPTAAEARAAAQQAAPEIRRGLDWIASMLEARACLFGAEPGLADFAVYHCLWFLARAPQGKAELARHAGVGRWMARMAELGHGARKAMEAGEAIEIAKAARPAALEPGAADETAPPVGAQACIRAVRFGRDPVRGEIVHVSADEIALRRESARAGEVIVHFPRRGYTVHPV